MTLAFLALASCTGSGPAPSALDAHAQDPDAHHTKTVDASELTEGTLAETRLDPSFRDVVRETSLATDANTVAVANLVRDVAALDRQVLDDAIRIDDLDIGLGVVESGLGFLDLVVLAQGEDVREVRSGVAGVHWASVGLPFADYPTAWSRDFEAGTLRYRNDTGEDACQIAPVQLPEGAAVTAFACTVHYPNDPADTLSCDLRGNDGRILATLSAPSSPSPDPQVVSTTSITSAAVLHAETTYYLRFCGASGVGIYDSTVSWSFN